jgi:hypothetical protein
MKCMESLELEEREFSQGPNQRKDIEHRAGKAARLDIWRKMIQPGEFCW